MNPQSESGFGFNIYLNLDSIKTKNILLIIRNKTRIVLKNINQYQTTLVKLDCNNYTIIKTNFLYRTM